MPDRTLERIIAWLALGASIEPPAALDARVRRRIRRPRRAGAPVLRPAVAVAVSLVSAVFLVTGLAGAVAEAPVNLPPVGLAFGAVLAYLALSGAAALPVLMSRVRRLPPRTEAG